MVSIIYSGRLGNNLFQYVAAYIFAKKFNFKIITRVVENKFNLPTLIGDSYSNNVIDVDDNNFMSLLGCERLEFANYQFIGYYQNKDFILKYTNQIRSMFDLNYNYKPIGDVFVSYRIGDINNSRQMLPIEYYKESLQKLNCKKGHITSDTMDHPNVLELSKEFNLTLYNDTPINTIDYAKNFNNLVLSEGSFSWWMGFLSNAKNIYYNHRERFWHGDMFVLPSWKPQYYDWDNSCYDKNNYLKCKKIIINENCF